MNKLFWSVKTLEELGEVSTAICKVMNYGLTNSGYDNKAALEEELGDLQHCLESLITELQLSTGNIAKARIAKAQKIDNYCDKSVIYVAEDQTEEDMKSAMRLQKANDE